MTDPVQRRPVRALPGAIPADRAIRDRTWWDALHGWPAGLPVDRRLVRRVRFETSRTSVRKDMNRRFDGRLAAASRLSLGTMVLVVVSVQGHQWTSMVLGETIWSMLAYASMIVAGTLAIGHRSIRCFHAPVLRAGLRREGVDCCIDCGQLMGRGEAANTCPECGRRHDAFPLEWGPGRLNDLAGVAPTGHMGATSLSVEHWHVAGGG